ncbi:MAG: site-specific integrase [Burkholderiales bacterium]|nr:site-specific integrase [Burkholderiales bacterium]
MTAPITSRSTTLEQIFNAIEADRSIDGRRRQDLLSALNTCVRVLGLPLANIPSEPRQLSPRLAAVAPAAHGITQRRWANIRSLVGKAIATAHPLLPGRQDSPLDPAWDALLVRLEPRYQRAAIVAGLRWLSGQGIGPACVTRDDVERFMEVLLTHSLRPKPEDVCRRFIIAWNRAVETVPGWPAMPLTRTSRQPVRSLSWSDLPASFKADVDRWLSRQRGDDLFAEDGPATPLKPVTLKNYEGIVRTSAWALVQAGVAPNDIRSLADLVSLPNFQLILQDLWNRTGRKKTATLGRRADVLIAMARHHLKLDEVALAQLRRSAKRVTPETTGLTQKNSDRLRPFDTPATFQALVNLPFAMRAQVDKGRLTPVRAAQRAEMAVAIAILVIAPIRIKNLRMIEIGRHLRTHGQRIMLGFVEAEVKNAVPLEFEIDEATAELITWYIDKHRPKLAPPGSLFLFPGRDGGPRSERGLTTPLEKALRKGIGLQINPHLFRHLAAKLFLDAHPGQYETVRQLLGHKTIVTTMRFYAGFETKAATKLYRGVVEAMRAKRLQDKGEAA